MHVEDLMSRRVATVRPTEGLDRVARLMQELGCGCVAVTDEESNVVGIVTDRDACMACLRTDKALSRLEARAAMSRVVFTCAPSDTIAEAERSMAQHQVRRLPVVDAQGSLRGILSLDDIAKEAWREEGLIAPPVSADAVGRTLGQISRPHLIEDARE